jgi:hypothetical protein
MVAHKLVPRLPRQRALARRAKTLSFHKLFFLLEFFSVDPSICGQNRRSYVGLWCQSYKTFRIRNFRNFVIS